MVIRLWPHLLGRHNVVQYHHAMSTQARTQILMTVGCNLKAAREARGLTQKQVGDALGVTNRDVSRWENGKVEPGAQYRQMLADELFDGQVSRLYDIPAVAA